MREAHTDGIASPCARGNHFQQVQKSSGFAVCLRVVSAIGRGLGSRGYVGHMSRRKESSHVSLAGLTWNTLGSPSSSARSVQNRADGKRAFGHHGSQPSIGRSNPKSRRSSHYGSTQIGIADPRGQVSGSFDRWRREILLLRRRRRPLTGSPISFASFPVPPSYGARRVISLSLLR